jgi:DNA end-binding protein Ku
MTKDDFKAAKPRATQTIDNKDFVASGNIENLCYEKPYYLVPQKNGVKGLFLLEEALKRMRKVAVATLVIRSKMHLTCIMPRGDYLILEMLRFHHVVLDANEVNYLGITQRRLLNLKEL